MQNKHELYRHLFKILSLKNNILLKYIKSIAFQPLFVIFCAFHLLNRNDLKFNVFLFIKF